MSLAKLEQRNALAKELQTLVSKDSLTEAEQARHTELIAEIRSLDTALDDYEAGLEASQTRSIAGTTVEAPAKIETPANALEIREVAKPKTELVGTDASSRAVDPYSKENRGVSYFQDRAILVDVSASNADVEESRSRLAAHYDAVGDEGSGRFVRAYSVGTNTEGGYLAPPQYLQDEFADLLAAGRPTADLVGKMALPATGQTFYIPTQTGGTAVAVHTENGAITETDATFGQIQVDACRVAGSAKLPNWLVDRSFPGADQIVMRDLAKQYAVKIDDIALNSSTSNRKGLLQETGLGAATATAGTATIANFWPALLNAIADVAQGIYAYPDAIVMHPRRWAWLAGQMDSQSRPVIGSLNPQNAVGAYGGFGVAGQFQGPVAVGTILGIPVYLDATIPITFGVGTDEDRVIVMKRDEPLLMENQPRFDISYENQFGNDQMVARVRGDVAFTCARRKGAVSIISGTALNDTV